MLCPPTMPTSPFSVPLPKSWPKHTKAATLHVISLAHFVLTHVRGFALNSHVHRVRIAAERDRLDAQVESSPVPSTATCLHKESTTVRGRIAAQESGCAQVASWLDKR